MHYTIGPICRIRAILMMLSDYKFSRSPNSISPNPILTALPGIRHELKLMTYIHDMYTHNIDVSPELTKHNQNDAHEFFLGLV